MAWYGVPRRKEGFPVETFAPLERDCQGNGPTRVQEQTHRGLLISSASWIIDRPARYSGPLIKIIMGTRGLAVLETERGREKEA